MFDKKPKGSLFMEDPRFLSLGVLEFRNLGKTIQSWFLIIENKLPTADDNKGRKENILLLHLRSYSRKKLHVEKDLISRDQRERNSLLSHCLDQQIIKESRFPLS